MAAEFRRHGVIDDENAESGAGTSIVVVLDGGMIVSVVGDSAFRQVRRQERASETQIREAVTDTAIATGAQRLLVVCDVRHTPDDKHARAIDWLRDLAHRIGYECSMNGLHDLATSIAAVRSDAEALRTAHAVMAWHKGIRRVGGWFAKRYAGADA